MDIIEWSVKTNGGGGEGWHRAPGGVEISGCALLDPPPLSSPSLSLSVISLASRKEKKKKERKKERKRERRKKKKKSPNNELRARAHRRARSSFIQTGNRARPGM